MNNGDIISIVTSARRELNALKALQLQRATDILKLPYSSKYTKSISYSGFIYANFNTANYSGEVPLATLAVSIDPSSENTNIILYPMLLRSQSASQLTWAIRVDILQAPFTATITLNCQIISNMKGKFEIYE